MVVLNTLQGRIFLRGEIPPGYAAAWIIAEAERPWRRRRHDAVRPV